jgi:DNA-binding CsgD family transcriptional regulator
LLRESLAIARQINHPRRMSFALVRLGNLLCTTCGYDEAVVVLHEALQLAVQTGERWQQALALRELGTVAYRRAEFDRAKEYLQSSLAIAQETGWQEGILSNLNQLGLLALATDDSTAAATYHFDALRQAVDSQEVPVILDLLIGIARLLIHSGNKFVAVELIAFCLHHPALHADTHQHIEGLLHEAHEQLPLVSKKSRKPVEVVTELLTLFPQMWPELTGDRYEPAPANQVLIEPLTPRELEVLSLLGAGHSNPQIARQLVVTIGTVKSHTHRVFAKLGVRTRTQAVLKAKALKLI